MLISKKYLNICFKKNEKKVFLNILGFGFGRCLYLGLQEIKPNYKIILQYKFSFYSNSIKFLESYLLSLLGLIKTLENLFWYKTQKFRSINKSFTVLRSPFKFKVSREVFTINKIKVNFNFWLINIISSDIEYFEFSFYKLNHFFGSSVLKNYSRKIWIQNYENKKT